MKSFQGRITFGAALIVVVLTTIVQGVWTDRWGVTQPMQEALDRLKQLPLTVGEWDGTVLELRQRELDLSGGRGGERRQFVNRRTGDSLTVVILCGRPGAMVVHTPDVCFPGAGYQLTAAPKTEKFQANANTMSFFRGSFRSPAADDTLEVAWSWSATGDWMAPSNPRLAFAHHSYLYKLYIVRSRASLGEPTDEGVTMEFAREFEASIRAVLFEESDDVKSR